MPGPSTSQSATCFFFLKTDNSGAEPTPTGDPGAVTELVDKGVGEETVLSVEDTDPAAAIGDDDGMPPLAAAVDAMIGPFDLLAQYSTLSDVTPVMLTNLVTVVL